jgi:hypothetical protein
MIWGRGVFSPLPNYKDENFPFDNVVYRMHFNAKKKREKRLRLMNFPTQP